jgi:hypothetical protein
MTTSRAKAGVTTRLMTTSRAKAVPKRKIAEVADISIVFIGKILDCLVTQHSYLAQCSFVGAQMVKE